MSLSLPKQEASGPEFVKWFGPFMRALHKLGGSARPKAVKSTIAEMEQVSAEELSKKLKSGALRFGNQIEWTRNYLAQVGLLDTSTRGLWKLSEKGLEVHDLTREESLELFRTVIANRNRESTPRSGPEPIEEYRKDVATAIKALGPSQFEDLCAYILESRGFTNVKSHGKSGDHGLDGSGLFRIGNHTELTMYFQCKKYSQGVGPGEVNEFLGSVIGKANLGYIFSSSKFTSGAKRAAGQGLVKIQLVDIDEIIDAVTTVEGVLVERKTYAFSEKGFLALIDNTRSFRIA